jgi:dihydropteroate synthase
MGVLNVTPDSFSDGGLWTEPDAAVAYGLDMVDHGAQIIDVGGESTRPGATRPVTQEELRRVLPVVAALAEAGAVVSIDTMRAQVARESLAAGATIVNDVSGGLADEAMGPLIAATGAAYVVMHWRGHSATMQERARYDDVVAEVARELSQRVDALRAQGVGDDQLILDPGLGFAKTAEHNWALLAGLGRLRELGFPLLVGTSRKRFLGLLEPGPDGAPAPMSQRDGSTAATSVVCALAGVWGVRVHDVPSTVTALRVAAAVREAR